MQSILRDGNCLSIVAKGEVPHLSGAGIVMMEHENLYTKVRMKGEFKCHTGLDIQKSGMYVDEVRFRVADAFRTSPLSGGIACQAVEVSIMGKWRRAFERILLLSRIEMGVGDDEMEIYEYLLEKNKERRLDYKEISFMEQVQKAADLFLQSFKEDLLCERNSTEGTAGEVTLF
ncbi:MAG: hypothetical protein PHH16_00345 [Candidatus Gracilibacteria bacterium]|nr:hypothetical protein [Candidatus Gracilibacteria bacterium]